MSTYSPLDELQRAKALQRIGEARARLAAAQSELLQASALLEAAEGIPWGSLSDANKVVRRLIIHGAHLAWAKIDACNKKIIAAGGPGALADDQQQERQGDEVEHEQLATEHHADGKCADPAGLCAPWEHP